MATGVVVAMATREARPADDIRSVTFGSMVTVATTRGQGESLGSTVTMETI